MNDIKFRAWDKEDFKLRQVLGMSFVHGAISVELNNEEYLQDYASRFELMQYTGLKDVNGVDIYEGDVVRITNNLQENEVDYSAQIIFKDGGFCAIDGAEDNYGVRRYRLSDFGYELKILGNIYENPELLGDSQ